MSYYKIMSIVCIGAMAYALQEKTDNFFTVSDSLLPRHAKSWYHVAHSVWNPSYGGRYYYELPSDVFKRAVTIMWNAKTKTGMIRNIEWIKITNTDSSDMYLALINNKTLSCSIKRFDGSTVSFSLNRGDALAAVASDLHDFYGGPRIFAIVGAMLAHNEVYGNQYRE